MGIPDICSVQWCFPVQTWDLKVPAAQIEFAILPVNFGVTSGILPRWHTLKRKAPNRSPKKMPEWLQRFPFDLKEQLLFLATYIANHYKSLKILPQWTHVNELRQCWKKKIGSKFTHPSKRLIIRKWLLKLLLLKVTLHPIKSWVLSFSTCCFSILAQVWMNINWWLEVQNGIM